MPSPRRVRSAVAGASFLQQGSPRLTKWTIEDAGPAFRKEVPHAASCFRASSAWGCAKSCAHVSSNWYGCGRNSGSPLRVLKWT